MIEVSGLETVISNMKKDLERRVHNFLDERGKTVKELSSYRLMGRFGGRFSHYYFNPDLQKEVRRYTIRHFQTGNLVASNKWRRVGNTVTIENEAQSKMTGEMYAENIAEIDWRELGREGDAWSWAAKQDMEHVMNSTSIQGFMGGYYQWQSQ